MNYELSDKPLHQAENHVDKNGWSTYEKLVLSELKRHNIWLEKLDEKFTTIQVQIVTMESQIKTKSMILATIISLVVTPIVGAVAVFVLQNIK